MEDNNRELPSDENLPEAETGAESVEPVPDDTPPPINAAPDYKQIAQRTAAEFDNYRKRIMKERQEWQKDVLARFLKDFFPAFDDLDRVIAEGEKAPTPQLEGIKLARANLWKTLETAGVKEIHAKNKRFDPRYHEAVAMVPVPDVPVGNVADILQAGYLLNDAVLRPARVVVAAEPVAPAAGE
ncbi:MAG: nucleotide exchange factor GrpE [Planctomycetota bacterium]|nr:nucleotide exchange factor GrpE [Planctomycetota bacterium]